MADSLPSFPPSCAWHGTTIVRDRCRRDSPGGRSAPLLVVAATPIGARPAAAEDDVEPLQCWWRTSVSAVRVGEPFTLVLTCAALQTDALTAVVDRARLDPRAIELPPFEVMGGVPAPDLRSGDRVFFQYQYTLRFINEAFFNEDVPLPALSVAYRIQSRVPGQDASTQGMERRFALPHQMIRIASLVPSDAADIRDATATTFADVDRVVGAGADARHHRHDRDRRSAACSRWSASDASLGQRLAGPGGGDRAGQRRRGAARRQPRARGGPARPRRSAAGPSISSPAPSPPRASSPSTRCPDRPASSTPRRASTRRPARWCCRAASGRRRRCWSRAR